MARSECDRAPRRLARGVFSLALLATLGSSMAFGSAAPFTPSSPQLSVDSLELATALASALEGARPALLRSDEWQTVRRLYRSPGASISSPIWLDGSGLSPRASELASVLASVDTAGLRPSDYGADAVAKTVKAIASREGEATSPAALARADVLMTASFVALVDDLLTGRVDPRKVEPTWHIATRTFDVSARVDTTMNAVRRGRSIRDVLATLRPDYGVYAGMVQGLARYRALEHAGGWPRLPAGPTLRAGDTGAAVSALRRRLAAEGYAAMSAGGDTLDAILLGAVAAFQQRHGLTVDSIVGPGTRSALNVPAAHRARQIEGSLERLRWLPPLLGDRFVVVNVPAFSLYTYEGGQRTLTMRVVVGDELVSRRTPIFADTMEYVEFGPYWNVPRSIAVNEILPRVRRDRGYLARNGFQLLRGWGDNAPAVDPSTLSNAALFSTRYRVRQLPGPGNALGRVKFMFPNDYAVYLHDTPAKARFDDADRSHSHGCVRVSDPAALAAFVLQDQTEWSPDRIAAALADGKRRRVDVTATVPVYLVYLTAFVRDGEVVFRDDIYDRDDRLLRALAGAGRK